MKTLSLSNLCERLASADLSLQQKAFSILLWYHDTEGLREMSSGQIAKIMYEHGLGLPHSTKLKEAMSRLKLATRSGSVFRLKASSRKEIESWLRPFLAVALPVVNQEAGYIPSALWKDSRGYLEKVCIQLNGCYEHNFPDAAAVLIRRIIETLIIEAFLCLKRDSEIKGEDGNYLMLASLVDRAVASSGLQLGRDTKRHLALIKELGDRSAHKRNYNAVKADLDKVQGAVRVAVDELINIADLRKK